MECLLIPVYKSRINYPIEMSDKNFSQPLICSIRPKTFSGSLVKQCDYFFKKIIIMFHSIA